MKNWWKCWLVAPALISLWWESKPEKDRKRWRKVADEAVERLTDLWEKPPVEKPKPCMDFELNDFDVMMVNTKGVAHGRTNSSEVAAGRTGKIKPGTYREILIESPSMDALKYTSMATYADVIKRWRMGIAGHPRSIDVNDSFDMGVSINLDGEIDLGTLHFRWDCE